MVQQQQGMGGGQSPSEEDGGNGRDNGWFICFLASFCFWIWRDSHYSLFCFVTWYSQADKVHQARRVSTGAKADAGSATRAGSCTRSLYLKKWSKTEDIWTFELG